MPVIYCLSAPSSLGTRSLITDLTQHCLTMSTMLSFASRGCWRDGAGGWASLWDLGVSCAELCLFRSSCDVGSVVWIVRTSGVHFPSHMPSGGRLRDWAGSHLLTRMLHAQFSPTAPLSPAPLTRAWGLFPTCPVAEDQLWPRWPTDLLHHPMGYSHIVLNEVWTAALRSGSPFQVCLPWVPFRVFFMSYTFLLQLNNSSYYIPLFKSLCGLICLLIGLQLKGPGGFKPSN